MPEQVLTLSINPHLVSTFGLCFLLSFGLCAAASLQPTLVCNFKHMASDLSAKQSSHFQPTPRIGGVAVIGAFGTGCLFFQNHFQTDMILVLSAGIVVFLAGLREDLFRDVSPRTRLIAAFASAGAAIASTGIIVPGLGLGPLDGVFTAGMVGICVTLLWSAGSCHALNLIDGLNGLASGYAILAAGAFCAIAGFVGEPDLQIAALLLIAALSGFFILNWPFGHIFLGDAGAYGVGHILAWLGILLMARNPEVAGTAVLLVMFWPVADTVYAMIRRRLCKKAHDRPDKMHSHHLVSRGLLVLCRHDASRTIVNSAATLMLLPLTAVPILAGIGLWNSGLFAGALLATLTGLFILGYVAGVRKFSRLRRLRATIDEMERGMFSSVKGIEINADIPKPAKLELSSALKPVQLTSRQTSDTAVLATLQQSKVDTLDALENAILEENAQKSETVLETEDTRVA